MLPTILISALLSLFLGVGGYLLLETWVDANAHEIAVPSWFNGQYDGAGSPASSTGSPMAPKSVDSQTSKRWRRPGWIRRSGSRTRLT
jgi:hypothetical protein